MKNTRNSRMQRGTGIFPCRCCGRRTRETGDNSVELCKECYEVAGIENALSDGHYENETEKQQMIAEIERLNAIVVEKGGKL